MVAILTARLSSWRRYTGLMPRALDVLLPLPMPPLTYLAPLQGAETAVGQRVVVPWQGGVRQGLVVAKRTVDAGRGLELRHVLHALAPQEWLNPAAIRAIDRMARSAGVPAGLVLATLNPPGLRQELIHSVRVRSGGGELAAELLHLLVGATPLPSEAWVDAATVPAAALEMLRAQGLLDERGEPKPRLTRVLVATRAVDDGLTGAKRAAQRTALEELTRAGSVASAAELARAADVSASSVRTLISRGYAEYRDVEAPAPPLEAVPLSEVSLPVTAAEAVPPAGDGGVVGGSRAARLAALAPRLLDDLAAGQSVLLLAPEQALAQESAGLLADRLPVTLLTGASSDEQRLRAWSELPSSAPQVLVGTFLALLAPLPDLGRVVVIEAGSSAYKLQSGARLFVPKAARQLAFAAEASLTLLDVTAGPNMLHDLPPGTIRQLPLPRMRLHLADLGSGGWPIHPDLLLTLKQVQSRERQALVLAPRRGFSGAFGCPDCGWLAPCPNCDLPLRYHRQAERLRCHQCGHDERPADLCPDCGGTTLGPLKGAGTQWIAGQLMSQLPDFPVYRYDADRRDDLAALYAGDPGVVVGTLALLSLAPLPQLSLIGVAHFDTHLAAGDYRAEEEMTRTMLRLAELSGGPRPLLVVQTHAPENELLQALASDEPLLGLETLLGAQLERRKRFGYPPFSTLAKLQFTARDRGSALAAAQHTADALLLAGASEDELLGPASAPVERLRGRYVFQLLLRAHDDDRLEALLELVPRRHPGSKLLIDVDPQDVGALLD